MTVLDLGSLRAYVTLDTLRFDAAYASTVQKMAQLGAAAETGAVGTETLDRGLVGTAGAAERAAVSADVLAASLGRAEGATGGAALAASRLTQAQLRQVAAQERVVTLESTEAASAGRLAAAQASLISASDRAAIAQERLATSSGLMGKVPQAAGRAMFGAGVVIAAGFALAEKATISFDSKMALVQTLSRATATDMKALRSAALTVGQAYGYTAGQVSDAEAELVKAGISVKDILGGALKGALTLAAAGQEDVAQATETAAIAMTQFKLSGRDVPHIADLLAAGADRALGSVSDLSEALKYGGLAASQAGFSIEETIGTLAEFAQAGLMGSSAGSTLQQMLRSLEHPTAAAQAVMKQYGIVVYDAGGHMLTTSAIAGELHDKIGTLPPALQNAALATMFSARAVRGATILMKDGASVNEQWIRTVNAQGFAALQASGKLNSLSGDWTKLKAAMVSAFIGAGETSQGPLRHAVQDAADLVNAWNRLPAPLKQVAFALVGVAGAAGLAGGAALMMIPKWAAMNAALEASGRNAITVGGALRGLAIGGAVVAGIVGVYEGVNALNGALHGSTPSVRQYAAALADLGQNATGTGRDLLMFLTQVAAHDNGLGLLTASTANLDQALAGLVTSGHADQAAADWAQMNIALHRAGLSTAEITKLFPQYAGALTDSATSAKEAGTGVDQFGNAVSASAKATRTATAAAQAYSDQLHALADPLFALNSALQDLRTKQDAATKAVQKHGAASEAAKQAQLDLASSSLQVETAARTLRASVDAGTTSMHQARTMLRGWVADGLLTAGQARAVAASFGGLIGKADHLAGSLRNAGAAARTSGRQIGWDFGQGLADGILSKVDTVVSAAHVIAAAAAQASKAQLKSKSPSRVMFGVGQDFGSGLALGIGSMTDTVVSAAAALGRSAAAATRHAMQTVYGIIAAAVAPPVTDPHALAGTLRNDTGTAVDREQSSSVATAHYRELEEHARALTRDLTELKRADAQAEASAKRHAQQLSNEAHAAHEAAANMTSHTKAQAAAKHAAEVHARALDDEARAASQAAQALAAGDRKRETSAQRLAETADKAASKAKAAADKAKQAASDAAQAAAAAAQALVSSVQDALDQMTQQITSFEQQISSGITGDFSLSSIWQQLSGTDANGDPLTPSLTGLQSNLNDILAATQNFSTDLNSLVSEGAGQDLISQIAGMGASAGDALAQQLLAAGPDAINALQSTLAAISSVADSEGQQLAAGFYGSGVSAMEQFIQGLLDQFPELQKALAPMLAELQALFAGVQPPSVSVGTGGGGGVSLPASVTTALVRGSDGAITPQSMGPITLTVPVTLDGREIARASGVYTRDELIRLASATGRSIVPK